MAVSAWDYTGILAKPNSWDWPLSLSLITLAEVAPPKGSKAHRMVSSGSSYDKFPAYIPIHFPCFGFPFFFFVIKVSLNSAANSSYQLHTEPAFFSGTASWRTTTSCSLSLSPRIVIFSVSPFLRPLCLLFPFLLLPRLVTAILISKRNFGFATKKPAKKSSIVLCLDRLNKEPS